MDIQARQQLRLWPALLLVTLAFFAATACWTLFSVSGVYLKSSLDLSQSHFGSILAIPLLSGAVVALLVGRMSAHFGPRRMILVCLAGLMVTQWLLLQASSLTAYRLFSIGLGLSGGVFVAGIHYVSQLCPRRAAGFCLGFFASGLIGAGFSYLIGPVIHAAYQWQVVPLAYMTLLGLIIALFALMTDPDARDGTGGSGKIEPLDEQLVRTPFLRLYLHYMFLFGAFVAMALWLPDYLAGRYNLSLNQAGWYSLLFTLPGALGQIFGGALADVSQTERVHRIALFYSACLLFLLSYPSVSMTIDRIDTAPLYLTIDLPFPLVMTALLGLGSLLGVGKGSQLRMLYDLSGRKLPVVAGVMVFSGCLTAAILPLVFGFVSDLISIRSSAFMLLFGLSALCVAFFEYELHRRGRAFR